jgi:hypothetical protein
MVMDSPDQEQRIYITGDSAGEPATQMASRPRRIVFKRDRNGGH